MASGFKTASVQTSQVPSTQTNFPAYVDLSRLGITTLAEAQSVRVYSDEAKTTELAREIVSASEMHVKVASIADSTAVFVDWDGVSSDYATNATYGAENVWSDYEFVWHGKDTNDSSGNRTITNNGSTTIGGDSIKIGEATDFNGSSQFLTFGDFSLLTGSTIQAWVNADLLSTNDRHIISKDASGANRDIKIFYDTSESELRFDMDNASTTYSVTSGAFNTATDYLVHGSYDGTTMRMFVNGSSVGTPVAQSGLSVVSSGNNWSIASQFDTYDDGWDGAIDEVRVREDGLTEDWATTEYNNQNDESSFWGTWTDAGTTTNNSAFFNFF